MDACSHGYIYIYTCIIYYIMYIYILYIYVFRALGYSMHVSIFLIKTHQSRLNHPCFVYGPTDDNLK